MKLHIVAVVTKVTASQRQSVFCSSVLYQSTDTLLGLQNVSYVCRRNVHILQTSAICTVLENTHRHSMWRGVPGLLWEQHCEEPTCAVASWIDVGTHQLSEQRGLNSNASVAALHNCIINQQSKELLFLALKSYHSGHYRKLFVSSQSTYIGSQYHM